MPPVNVSSWSDPVRLSADGAADTVTDFTAGEDTIDLRAITSDIDFLNLAMGDEQKVRIGNIGDDSWITGTIIFEQVGDDVSIKLLSRSGERGRDSLEDIALLSNVTVDQLSLSDLQV